MRIASAASALFLALALPTVGLAQPATREITNINGDLYRFRNNGHYSVFLVTPAGVIATDPIDKDAAGWLKAEIAQRFKVPVKYVIYSHGHADHDSGGEVFADTATFVGHAIAKQMLADDRVPTPLPTETFTDTKTVTLGGASVELTYLGPNHADGMIVMRFPKERTLFAVDIVPVDSLAYRDFPNADINGWIRSLKAIEQMDFDTLAPGHGPMATRDHVRRHREYLEDLQAQVVAQVKAGKSLAETKAAVDLTKYRTWGGYDTSRDLNIEGMYRMMGGTR
ncbi:MAG: MBL fold metallo-hydrolase [Vicinamibacterales bacterium]